MTAGHGFNMAYTLNFEKATVDFDLSRGAEALKVFEEGKKPRVMHCKGADGYVGELRHMIDSIQAGKAPTIVTPQDALSAVQICEAEEKSIRTGKPVRLA
jgi:predicted dehydrogenase